MDVNCPVCDKKLSSSGLDGLSMAFRQHLVDEHGHSRLKGEEAAQKSSPLGSETIEECVTRTFSESMCKVESEESKVLKEKVTQWKYPRVGPTGERGAAFVCPVCGEFIPVSDENMLSPDLKKHFDKVHEIEKSTVEVKR